MSTIELKYVALSPIQVQAMDGDVPVLDENGEYVFINYAPGDRVDERFFRPAKLSAMVEYRRLLPVASDTSGTVTPVVPSPVGEPQMASRPGSPTPLPPVTSYAAEFPRHVGGPWYLLSNGEKVKGKLTADQAEAELKG